LIVVTVLIILMSIVGVAIIWGGVLPMLRFSEGCSDLLGQFSVVSSRGYTVYDAEDEVVGGRGCWGSGWEGVV